MATRDLIGKRGEAIVTARLMDFCGNLNPYFDVHPLGEKCPTFDYLVNSPRSISGNFPFRPSAAPSAEVRPP